MCAEVTLGEFAISLVLVISCEPVKVDSESRNISEEQRVLPMAIKTIIGIPCSNILANVYIYYIRTSPFSLMGNQTVHEDCFKYKLKLS